MRGIDPSVGPEELVRILAASGDCKPDQIRLGPIRRNVRGVQSAWVRCPLSSAVKLVDLQKVEAGWSAMHIELLKIRPTQCFKCWNYSHVRSICRASIDRSGNCFNCGKARHSIGNCNSLPNCVICREAGMSHSHRMRFYLLLYLRKPRGWQECE